MVGHGGRLRWLGTLLGLGVMVTAPGSAWSASGQFAPDEPVQDDAANCLLPGPACCNPFTLFTLGCVGTLAWLVQTVMCALMDPCPPEGSPACEAGVPACSVNPCEVAAPTCEEAQELQDRVAREVGQAYGHVRQALAPACAAAEEMVPGACDDGYTPADLWQAACAAHAGLARCWCPILFGPEPGVCVPLPHGVDEPV